MTFTVTNTTTTNVTAIVGPAASFIRVSQNTNLIYYSYKGGAAVLQPEVFVPGETKIYNEYWGLTNNHSAA